jgi:hypothetical protein
MIYQLILQGICRQLRKPEQAFLSLALYIYLVNVLIA